MGYISKKLRQQVYDKFNGRCAYTGTFLKDDWQIDHLKPQIHFEIGLETTDKNDISNLMPTQKIVNHYKRGLPLKDFKEWYLAGLHERINKLPKHPKVEKSIKRKRYLLEVANLFGINKETPFCGKLYFETLN